MHNTRSRAEKKEKKIFVDCRLRNNKHDYNNDTPESLIIVRVQSKGARNGLLCM